MSRQSPLELPETMSHNLLYPYIGSDVSLIIQLLDLGYQYNNIIGIDAQPGRIDFCGSKQNYFSLILDHFRIHGISVVANSIDNFPWVFDFTYRSKDIRISLYYSVSIGNKVYDKVTPLSSLQNIIPEHYSLILGGPIEDYMNLIQRAEYTLCKHDLFGHRRADVTIHQWNIDYGFPEIQDPTLPSYVKSHVKLVDKMCYECLNRYYSDCEDLEDSEDIQA